MLTDQIKALAQDYNKELIAIRRYLHQHPELSFEETASAAYIREKLHRWAGIPLEGIQPLCDTGTVVLLRGEATGEENTRCIALRADIDALPIQETNDVPYCSVNEGIMHACGHDVHATCLLGAAKILYTLRAHWSGCIKLIFQPGEEKHPGGASLLTAAGVLENPKVEAIFGTHCDPDMPVGTVGFCPAYCMASADEIYLNVSGQGGHAARPHTLTDTVLAAAQILVALQQIVARRANPLTPTVLTFGKIYSDGGATNVVPDSVHLHGTLRTFDETWRKQAYTLIEQIAQQTAATFGASITLDIPEGYPALYNAPALCAQTQAIAQNYLQSSGGNAIDIPPRMGGEDFSFYAQKVPACFYRIGTKKEGATALHTATFDIDESALPLYAGLLADIATQSLKNF